MQLVPGFLEAVLTDYAKCSDVWREASCLNVCSALIEELREQQAMAGFIPKIFGTLFQVTLDTIKDSMENHPDHRGAVPVPVLRDAAQLRHRCSWW